MDAYGLEITGFDEVFAGNERIIEILSSDRVLRTAVLNMQAEIVERIQQRGEASDGSPIGGGSYSPRNGRYRDKRGYQTNYIDMTLSGDMLDRGFIAGPAPAGGFGLGWLNTLSRDKAERMEQYFGRVFSPSQDERDHALDLIAKATRDVISESD
jgi:hypothetical protein